MYALACSKSHVSNNQNSDHWVPTPNGCGESTLLILCMVLGPFGHQLSIGMCVCRSEDPQNGGLNFRSGFPLEQPENKQNTCTQTDTMRPESTPRGFSTRASTSCGTSGRCSESSRPDGPYVPEPSFCLESRLQADMVWGSCRVSGRLRWVPEAKVGVQFR